MRLRTTFFTIFTLIMAGSLAAQSRSVTNDTLSRYKEDRARANREYLDNYERLGMPSPAEIQRRKDESHAEMIELAKQLRSENLERQRLAAELLMNERLTTAHSQHGQAGSAAPFYGGSFSGGGYFYSDPYGGYDYGAVFGGHRNRNRFGFRRPFHSEGYVGGGQFWPTGPRTRSSLIFAPRRVRSQPLFSPNR